MNKLIACALLSSLLAACGGEPLPADDLAREPEAALVTPSAEATAALAAERALAGVPEAQTCARASMHHIMNSAAADGCL